MRKCDLYLFSTTNTLDEHVRHMGGTSHSIKEEWLSRKKGFVSMDAEGSWHLSVEVCVIYDEDGNH